MVNVSYGMKLFAVAASAGLLLSGCSISTPEPKAESTAPPEASAAPSSTEPAEPQIPDIRDADFGNMTWIDPVANGDKDAKVRLKNKRAVAHYNEYELGETIYSDLNSDGVEDAVVSLISGQGNGYWQQYFAWISTVKGPVQVVDPIETTQNCGSLVDEVKAVDGGVRVTTFMRSRFQDTACAEKGPLKQVKTVSVKQFGDDPNYYLIQNEPGLAYGGSCESEPDGDVIAVQIPVYAAPNKDSLIPMKKNSMMGYMFDPTTQGQQTDDGQWVLAPILEKSPKSDKLLTRCAWLPTSKNSLYEEGQQVMGANGPAG